ncbi:MAG: dihydrolipoyl dehydrogenase [Dehalobacterium sp.]
MATEVIMPQMGLTMTEGRIIRWLKGEGDQISKNEPLLEIESDKASFQVDSPGEGDTVPIGKVIGYLGQLEEEAGQPFFTVNTMPQDSIRINKNNTGKTGQYDFSILVIGGGPGGYVAAIHAAQLGVKTALIEKADLGGTCLNRGCIPTKALLASSERVAQIKQGIDFGIKVSGLEVDFPQMVSRKNKIVSRLRNGVKYLLQKNKVDVYQGSARFLDDHVVAIEGNRTVSAEKIIIATGSVPRKVTFSGDNSRIVFSDDILNLREIPDKLLIVGGGVIGIEFGSLFNNLGSQVTIVEIMERVLPQMDGEIADMLTEQLTRKGIRVFTSSKVAEIKPGNDSSTVVIARGDGSRKEISADKVLVALGRTAYMDELNLEAAGVAYGTQGILVSENFSTNISHIYAVGDVTGGVQLAHLASAQGMRAVEQALGKKSYGCLKHIPSCIYTDPEVASVGLTEEQLKKAGRIFKVAKFPLSGSGKALAMGAEEGLMKIIYDSQFGEVLGTHLLAPRATDIIAEAALAMRGELTVGEISTTIHAHPTLAEAFMEAAHIAHGTPIHAV